MYVRLLYLLRTSALNCFLTSSGILAALSSVRDIPHGGNIESLQSLGGSIQKVSEDLHSVSCHVGGLCDIDMHIFDLWKFGQDVEDCSQTLVVDLGLQQGDGEPFQVLQVGFGQLACQVLSILRVELIHSSEEEVQHSQRSEPGDRGEDL